MSVRVRMKVKTRIQFAVEDSRFLANSVKIRYRNEVFVVGIEVRASVLHVSKID